MIFVCPKPIPWIGIHKRLLAAWETSGRQGEPPPGPLILSNWIYSSDLAKQDRWRETIEWAERNSCQHLLLSLTEHDCYYTHRLSTSNSYPGQNWGNQIHPPAERPTDSDLAAYLQQLRDEWATIAGPELSAACEPIMFSGAKARRLVVTITAREINPPWGSWFKLDRGSARSTFTAFRQRINDAITPHHVDHVDFRYAKPGSK